MASLMSCKILNIHRSSCELLSKSAWALWQRRAVRRLIDESFIPGSARGNVSSQMSASSVGTVCSTMDFRVLSAG